MKKQNLVNLVKYHVEKDEAAFTAEVTEIAHDFESSGDSSVAQYLMEFVSNAHFYVPQFSYKNLRFLQKIECENKPLFLPSIIEEDITGIVKAINNRTGLSKFLFFGAPGTGKTESAYQIARLLNRDLLMVSFEQLVDSKLGETAKNVLALFEEINHLPYGKVIVLFDEIDTLVLDRFNQNDLREMGRVTSTFLKCLDRLNENVMMIATTNLIKNFDKAIVRRFDASISFDRYTRDDLIEIADSMLAVSLKRASNSRQDFRTFNKILRNLAVIPSPGDLKQIIRTSIAFSDESSEYDYLRKIYLSFNDTCSPIDIQKLSESGFTMREIEILTRVSKSSVSRKLKRTK